MRSLITFAQWPVFLQAHYREIKLRTIKAFSSTDGIQLCAADLQIVNAENNPDASAFIRLQGQTTSRDTACCEP